jgi:hypothetical protein
MIGEGWALYGGVRCTDCESDIDLSEADSQEEAIEIWNEHEPCQPGVDNEEICADGGVYHFAACSDCPLWKWADTAADAEEAADEHGRRKGHDAYSASIPAYEIDPPEIRTDGGVTANGTAPPKPDRKPDLREALTDEQLVELREAAQAERFTARCVGSGVRCRTDSDAHLGTFITHDRAVVAAEGHDHAAVARCQAKQYVAVCLDRGCDGVWMEEWAEDARAMSDGHRIETSHLTVYERAPRLVAEYEGCGR